MKPATDRDGNNPSPFPGIFAFELDFGGSLRCIPMSVRLKLDLAGIKMSLKQWNKIPEPLRRQLVEASCGNPEDISAYKRVTAAMIREFALSVPEELPVDSAPVWSDLTQVPQRIRSWASSLGLPAPTSAQWRGLGPVQRFALYKLTRPGHSNDNFIPAMKEFGLLSSLKGD